MQNKGGIIIKYVIRCKREFGGLQSNGVTRIPKFSFEYASANENMLKQIVKHQIRIENIQKYFFSIFMFWFSIAFQL